MNNIQVSIIIPSFNQGEFIEETIKSVLNQTYKNIQLIIVDGNSIDDTKNILEKYMNKDNIEIIIENDNGQSDAINKGFKKATGELVGWINSDDILLENTVQTVVNNYLNNKEVSIIYGDIILIDTYGNEIGELISNEISYEYLLNINPDVTQPGSFYKTDIINKVNYLDEKIHYTMDYDLWLRLLKERPENIRLNQKLAKFRIHNNSKTSGGGTFFKFWNDVFEIRRVKHNTKGIRKIHLLYIRRIVLAVFNKFLKRTI